MPLDGVKRIKSSKSLVGSHGLARIGTTVGTHIIAMAIHQLRK